MNSSFLDQQIVNCVNEFYYIYNLDEYISKKRYEQFLDKYKDIFVLLEKYDDKENDYFLKIATIAQNGYDIVDMKNSKFINKHLTEDKEYFDNIFRDINSDILLDTEQRKAILCDEDYSLIIAGAGSGKTTTMAAKVKYLVEKRHVNPKEIILMSFTNKATEELNDILNNKFHLNVEVLTFHKLGMKFVRSIIDAKPKIISDSGIYTILSQYFVENVFLDKEKLRKYISLFPNRLYLDENVFNFDTYDAYYQYYTKVKYEECKPDLKEENSHRIYNRMKYLKTINGEYVDSEGEVKIANYLYKNGIEYVPGALYPFKLANGRTYKPDFTIHNLGQDIYIEYYGLAKYHSSGEIESNVQHYKSNILRKRKTHQYNHTEYIELFGNYEDNSYFLKVLSNQLYQRHITKVKRTEKEIFYRLLETSKDSKYVNLIRFFISFIGLFKELGYTKDDFKYLKQCTDNVEVQEQLDLLEEVFIYYQNKIHEVKDGIIHIDFQDMIHYAYSRMEKLKKENVYHYKYIIIDEYQDISKQRYDFSKKISDLFGAKIVAVGDDYQTIFSFSGSDIELFTKFYESMGYAEITAITKTYRNSQELIDIAGNFVQKNKLQIVKRLTSDKHLEKPIELVEYDYNKENDNLPEVLSNLLCELYKQDSKSRILLLCRFNDEIDNLIHSKLFYQPKKKESKIICKACSNSSIDILTVHKSKGLGYDQVILLNALNIYKGFPSQIEDELVIQLLKRASEIKKETIEYPEERRLFYVAMTRTKNKLYVMVPQDYQYRSEFIKEIESENHVTVRHYKDKLGI